jgi:lipoprotein-anchoring transpeptidase ErfK/SrfK
MTVRVDRRGVLAGIAVLLGGCATQRGWGPGVSFNPLGNAAAYGPINDHGHEIPGLDLTRIDPSLLRQQVAFAGPYRPGTIVVNIGERHLYFLEPGGVAIRYSVGVGREEALNFRGSAVIRRKAEWPHWTPTADMIHRMPIYAHYTAGLPGGIDNPLGARALYLYRGNQDTYFRLHGTIEPETIGQKVSSGCIRLFNHDIIDLYNRAPVGTQVVVLQEGESMRAEAGPETDGYYEAGPEPIGPYAGPPGPYAGPPGSYAGPYYEPPPWASGY